MKKGKNTSNKGESSNKKSNKKPSKFGLLNTISMGLLILFLITGIYSIITDQNSAIAKTTLSGLAQDVQVGKV